MKTSLAAAGSIVGVLVGVLHSAAGPSLPVTKPPVQPLPLMTGPGSDPAAARGQWFMDAGGIESVRTNEFHDEALGGFAGANAISGHVDSITFAAGPGTPITAFTIQATIINDATPGAEWSAGSNRHGESLNYLEAPYVGPLVAARLVAEFCIADTNTLPPAFTGPYLDFQPYIEAVNEDLWAWYCWSPLDPDPGHQPSGNYFVPAWEFGTIPIGQAATRRLSFAIPAGGLLPGDARYAPIVQSFALTNDILLNRALSLKISTWIETLAVDALQQEEPPARLSDVSVFHDRGEEEPYLDFGDAPDAPYPTLLANNGARHVVVPGVRLGTSIDAEPDGQPDATATGDDLAGLADEDGVSFINSWVAGQVATVQVVASTSGIVSAWVDFDANGWWGDFGENVLAGAPVAAGTNWMTVNVPAGAKVTNTFARFRFTTLPVAMTYTGLVANGEVEDHALAIQPEEEEPLDFGDATDSSGVPVYPTLLANNGARHVIAAGVFLGATIDAEPDGQPDGTATGDDNNPPAGLDDEDGVGLPAVLVAGATVPVPVVASVPGFLNAWIDWNGNGTWLDPGEQVFLNYPLSPGPNLTLLAVPLPPALVSGGPQSRWRFTTYAPALPAFTGAELDGEVEDYEVNLQVLDFGDSPEPPYPTLLASDGARHLIPPAPVYYLGATPPDLDSDGQPSPDAKDDDNAGADDEDGVFAVGGAPLVRGDPSSALGVICSTSGYLNGWLDFDNNGSWADAGEQIAADRAMPAGFSALVFGIPAGAQVGPVVGRFRFASAGGLSYTGLAADGEVEDHEFTIYQNSPDTNAFFITNITHAATNRTTIEWAGNTGAVYETQYILDLPSTASPPWTAWGSWVTGAALRQVDTNAAETAKHYRVVAPYSPPP